jgi:hypothetical protein
MCKEKTAPWPTMNCTMATGSQTILRRSELEGLEEVNFTHHVPVPAKPRRKVMREI